VSARLEELTSRIEELRRRRDPLFNQLENNPHQLHLVLEIKIIDDQIADCNELTCPPKFGPAKI
jgi:hypothetical protein